MIMGAYANKSYQTAPVADPRASGYYLNKISGTSQATPQVTGMLACVLQARPSMTPAEARQFVIDHSLKNVLQEGTDTSYTSTTYLQGGNNRYLKTPFTDPNRGGITSE
jgi:subtilisin family serine protease